jgi:hypothetical protein
MKKVTLNVEFTAVAETPSYACASGSATMPYAWTAPSATCITTPAMITRLPAWPTEREGGDIDC